MNNTNAPKVKIFNPDGSEAEKSGNGVRIFSKYLLDKGYVKEVKLMTNVDWDDIFSKITEF